MTMDAGSQADAKRGRRAAVVWGSVVVGLLGLQVALCVIGVTLATRGKAYAEHDYYDKALHWDEQKAAMAASDALGWTVQFSVADIARGDGSRPATLTLLDRNRAVIRDAKVSVVYLHHARPGEKREATLAATEPGLYSAPLMLARPGKWEFRLRATRGSEVYMERIVRDVSRAAFSDSER